MTNTNVAFTVREISESVPIVATASFPASVDILELAGCNRVLELGEMLGQSLARRILGRDAKSHVIGSSANCWSPRRRRPALRWSAARWPTSACATMPT
jgi:hypothetical protein